MKPSSAMRAGPFALVARVTRNGGTECWHYGACAVCTPDGRLMARFGDAGQATFLRSGAKPFQAIPFLCSGGWRAFDLESADLALMCGSHAGMPEHVARARRLLEKGEFGPEHLLCGTHEPFDEASARRLAESGQSAGPLHNNCSGKHAGMLLACRLLNLPTEDYPSPDHPLQQKILQEVGEFCGVTRPDIGIATDGCSVPTYRLPLSAAARGYAALAAPELAGVGERRQEAVERIVEAMTRAPAMVAGPGRFTTRLMEVSQGRILGKEGAKGFYALAIRGPVALGVALKIADGSERCRDGVVLDLLRQLGSLSAAEFEELAPFHRIPIRSLRGAILGEVLPEVELEEIAPP